MWIIERSKVVGISEVENWDKNPREIMRDEYESLKKQIQTLGVYKPLLCTHENGKYIAIGGNMRLRALKELKFTEAWISVIEVDSEEEKIRISLSDNNRAGYYEEERTAELIYPYKDKIWKDFKLDFEMPKYDLDSFKTDYFKEGSGDGFDLPDGDKAPFQQMTFTLHNDQIEQVKKALKIAKEKGDFIDSPNENSNGNALARVCETYSTEHGNG